MRAARLVLTVLFVVTGCVSMTPPPVAGTGTIRFGAEIDEETITLVGPEKQTFHETERMAYVMSLIEPARSASLRWVVAKVSAGGGSERVSFDQPLQIANPDSAIFGNTVELRTLMPYLDGYGAYVMRVFRDATLLAQGAFAIVP